MKRQVTKQTTSYTYISNGSLLKVIGIVSGHIIRWAWGKYSVLHRFIPILNPILSAYITFDTLISNKSSDFRAFLVILGLYSVSSGFLPSGPAPQVQAFWGNMKILLGKGVLVWTWSSFSSTAPWTGTFPHLFRSPAPSLWGLGQTKLIQSCLTLDNAMDSSLPDSSVHGILQARNIGVGCHVLLQGILWTQGSNPHLRHGQAGSFGEGFQLLYCPLVLGKNQALLVSTYPKCWASSGIQLLSTRSLAIWHKIYNVTRLSQTFCHKHTDITQEDFLLHIPYPLRLHIRSHKQEFSPLDSKYVEASSGLAVPPMYHKCPERVGHRFLTSSQQDLSWRTSESLGSSSGHCYETQEPVMKLRFQICLVFCVWLWRSKIFRMS